MKYAGSIGEISLCIIFIEELVHKKVLFNKYFVVVDQFFGIDQWCVGLENI